MVIDSHCHLAGSEFEADLATVVTAAVAAEVGGALVVLSADDAGELDRSTDVSTAWPAVRFTAGVHPHAAAAYASGPVAAAERVSAALQGQPLARAIGEIGLDYHYDFAPRDVQQAVFREQLRLARARSLPVVIHTREAEDDTFRILWEEGAGEVGGVFHCFTGDRAMARRALDAGFHLSLSGIVTFPRAVELHEVARFVPLDRLLVETDSPYLAPVPYRGRRNEPAYVVRVAQVVAELRGVALATIADSTTMAFSRLFAP